MGLVIMNLGEIAKQGILLALKTMFKIEPSDPPLLEMNIVVKPRIYAKSDSYAAFIQMTHKEIYATGYISLILPKKRGRKLLGNIGIKNPSNKEAADFTGEFCNIIAGMFKTEVIKLGLGAMDIGLPKTFGEGVDMILQGVQVDTKYTVSVSHEEQPLLSVEVAFASTQHKGLKERWLT